MKTFVSLSLCLVLTASLLVGCGCTNQNMDNTSAPTVLPTNEELWDNTETTTHSTTGTTAAAETTGASTAPDTTGGTAATDAEEGSPRSTVKNYVNSHTEMMDQIREKEKSAAPSESTGNSSRMMPGTR